MMKTTIAAALALALASGAAMAEFKDFTVNGQLVTKAQQEALASEAISSNPNPHEMISNPQIEDQVRQMMIEQVVMGEYARKQGIDKLPEVQADVARATNMVLENHAVREFLKKNPVTEKEIEAQYKQEADRWGDKEVRVRHILVKTEDQAKNLISRLNKGADFGKLAQEFSEDTGNKGQGGLLGWVVPRSFVPAFGASFTALKPGEIAQSPIRTQFGFHVVKLEAKRKAELYPSYESQKPVIRNALANQKVQMHFQDLIKKANVQ